jgi:UDP-N-acetylmuramoyl-L-alanyl-D-glutamate--2,6-diaminopimelate ligase
MAGDGDFAEMNPDTALLDMEISGLTADSRRVEPGFLFAALPGSQADGRDFIPEAMRRGAAAVLSSEPWPDRTSSDIPILVSENPRRRLALMAARFHGAAPATIAAVTGTNGKTSVASFTRQIWSRLGNSAGSLGTLGIDAPGYEKILPLTTPDPVELHKDLAALAAQGIDHLALEASSHGLDQCRLDGVAVSAAAFTNLTRDHIDYHGSTDAYRRAKFRLFEVLMAPGGHAVLNADSPEFEAFAAVCRDHLHQVTGYGRSADENGIRLHAAMPRPDGLALKFSVSGRRYACDLPLVGEFQAMNALCALGLVLVTGPSGIDFERAAVAALADLEGAPGRMQLAARHPNGAPVYVDYAHTPDALETVLTALRPHTAGLLAVVFGCGGDRDAGKRPMMGEIAARLADRAIVTDDNPRTEDPAVIRRQILAACPGGAEAESRAQAIDEAIAQLGPEDLLVIAGKGHERGQIVGDAVHPFDDAQAAREAAARLAEDVP